MGLLILYIGLTLQIAFEGIGVFSDYNIGQYIHLNDQKHSFPGQTSIFSAPPKSFPLRCIMHYVPITQQQTKETPGSVGLT